jgi:hypothetical protein
MNRICQMRAGFPLFALWFGFPAGLPRKFRAELWTKAASGL